MRIYEDASQYETWKNNTEGSVVLKREGRRAGELTDELITGGQLLHLTPGERRLNQEMAASPQLDVFQNGLLTPVKLIETSEDLDEMRGNPNHLTETDMVELFKVKTIGAFRERIAGVENPLVLQRLVAMADSDEVDARQTQVKALKERLSEVSTSAPMVQVIESSGGSKGIGTMAPPAERTDPSSRR